MAYNENVHIKCGYCGWVMRGTCSNIEAHECFRNYNEDLHLLQVDNDHVARMIPRNTYEENDISNTEVVPSKHRKYLGDTTNELLIELVQARPSLWNYTLPLQERTNIKKDALWAEISNEMGGGNMTIKWVKDHWKYLRDAYMKARKVSKQYVPSGSSTDSAKAIKKHSFRFFERMKFLEISVQTESTISSLPLSSTASSSSESLNVSVYSHNTHTPQQENIAPFRNENDMDLNTIVSPSSSPGAFHTTLNRTSMNAYVKPPVKRNLLASSSLPMRKAKSKPGSSYGIQSEPESEEVQFAILNALREKRVGSDAVDGILLRLGEGLHVAFHTGKGRN
ncbi:PREDICTED: uncharacterized protein LOC108777457 [Cyphomyrmex costatus]|uniref:uncharacterized protein LOC108777457 n=1 Tax=Cyphomyrmex costatus TaxID=456900 RepID=UPI0008522321|nr:PREDICTED: uncharacterized protein LOC108777457 [Cyphomyrmex costatus]